MESWYCLCMGYSSHYIQCLLLYRSCARLGRSPYKHWCAVLCSAFGILESLVKLLQVSFLVVCQFLLERLDNFIFVSVNTVKLLELSALLMTTRHAAGSHAAGTEIQNASLPQPVV